MLMSVVVPEGGGGGGGGGGVGFPANAGVRMPIDQMKTERKTQRKRERRAYMIFSLNGLRTETRP
jgi:hypothetical protein